MTTTTTPASDGTRDDVTLLRAHVAGDPDAFAELFARHRDRLWAVALRTAGDPEEAADALQDAMVAAYRKAGDFRGEAAVTTWWHRIVVNACLDRRRRAKVRQADPLPDDLEERASRGHLIVAEDAEADPAQRAVASDRRERVLGALRQLPEEQRTCLVLVDLEGWSVADVAERLGVAAGTVKSRCHRGRARLAELLPDLAPQAAEQTQGTAPPAAASDSPGPGVGTARARPDPTTRPTNVPDPASDPATSRGGDHP